MGNVTLPTPVFLAGGALCLLGGILVGSVVFPNTADRTTATVVSYDTSGAELCLEGDAIKDQDGVDPEGRLCGTLRRTPDSRVPRKGDDFRFVSISTSGEKDGEKQQQVVIYGAVVG